MSSDQRCYLGWRTAAKPRFPSNLKSISSPRSLTNESSARRHRLRYSSGGAEHPRRCCRISDDYWRDIQFLNRHIERYPFTLMSYPPNSPAARAGPDWKPAAKACPAATSTRPQARRARCVRHQVFAICNVLHGAIALFNEDMAAALCAAVNDWTVEGIAFDRDPRLRGVDPAAGCSNPELAGSPRSERVAHDQRFVQVTMLVMGDALARHRGANTGRSTRPPRNSA